METIYRQYDVTDFRKEELKRYLQTKEVLMDAEYVRTPSNEFVTKGSLTYSEWLEDMLAGYKRTPFGYNQEDWELLVLTVNQEDGTMFYFQSPWETWNKGDGMAGYAVEVNGRVVDGFFTYITHDRERRINSDSV